MKMLQRIVSAFNRRHESGPEARAEMPVETERSRIGPGAPGDNDYDESDEPRMEAAGLDPSVAARRLWCAAGHF